MESDRTHEPVPVYEIVTVLLLATGLSMLLIPGFSLVLGATFTLVGSALVLWHFWDRIVAVWHALVMRL